MTDKSSKSSHRKTCNLEDNENCRSCRENPYRLESQEQTLIEVLAQSGRNNRFNGPFDSCQKKSVMGTAICQLKCSDKPSSKTRKGSLEFRAETPIKWGTFGCLVHKVSSERKAMKQGVKVSYITPWLKLAAAKQRLNRKMRRPAWSAYQEVILTSLARLPS
jgi:hypothetical protein